MSPEAVAELEDFVDITDHQDWIRGAVRSVGFFSSFRTGQMLVGKRYMIILLSLANDACVTHEG